MKKVYAIMFGIFALLATTACERELDRDRVVGVGITVPDSSGTIDPTTPTTEASEPEGTDATTTSEAEEPEGTDALADAPADPAVNEYGLTEEQMLELMELITIKTITATPCVDLVGEALPGTGTVAFDIGALKKDVSQGGPRLWTDALSVPVPKELYDPEVNMPGLVQFLDEQSCVNPHFGVADFHRFAHMEFAGVKLVEELPWLKPFAVDVEELEELVSEFVFNDLTVEQKADPELQVKAIEANLEWQEMAAKLNTLRSRFALFGIMSVPSDTTYHLVGVTGVGDIPEIGFDPNPDLLPALVYGVSLKNSCPQLLFGYNLGDQRPEVFKPQPCEPPPPVTTVPPPRTTVPPPVHTTPTTTTTPPPSTTIPPPPTTGGGKDAGDAPATTTVVTCPEGQHMSRETNLCVPTVPPTTAADPGPADDGDSGEGAPGPGDPPITSDPAPDPTVVDTTVAPGGGPPSGR